MAYVIEIYPHGGADPEGMNERRAEWGNELLDRIQMLTGTDPEDAACNAICDILHAEHAAGRDPVAAIVNAVGHFREETTPPPEPELITYTAAFHEVETDTPPLYHEPLVYVIRLPRRPAAVNDTQWPLLAVEAAESQREGDTGFKSVLRLLFAIEGEHKIAFDGRI